MKLSTNVRQKYTQKVMIIGSQQLSPPASLFPPQTLNLCFAERIHTIEADYTTATGKRSPVLVAPIPFAAIQNSPLRGNCTVSKQGSGELVQGLRGKT